MNTYQWCIACRHMDVFHQWSEHQNILQVQLGLQSNVMMSHKSQFQISVLKPKAKQLLWPITRDADTSVNQSAPSAGKSARNCRLVEKMLWVLSNTHKAKQNQSKRELLSPINWKVHNLLINQPTLRVIRRLIFFLISSSGGRLYIHFDWLTYSEDNLELDAHCKRKVETNENANFSGLLTIISLDWRLLILFILTCERCFSL